MKNNPASKTDRNGDPVVGAILDIIDVEHSRYKVAVAVAEFVSHREKQLLEELLAPKDKGDKSIPFTEVGERVFDRYAALNAEERRLEL